MPVRWLKKQKDSQIQAHFRRGHRRAAPYGALVSHAEASGVMYACDGWRDGRVVDGGGLENH
jgi:hypothetical protein